MKLSPPVPRPPETQGDPEPRLEERQPEPEIKKIPDDIGELDVEKMPPVRINIKKPEDPKWKVN